jgi:hypothetical protein
MNIGLKPRPSLRDAKSERGQTWLKLFPHLNSIPSLRDAARTWVEYSDSCILTPDSFLFYALKIPFQICEIISLLSFRYSILNYELRNCNRIIPSFPFAAFNPEKGKFDWLFLIIRNRYL